jgi:hypothetical protein
MQCIICIFLAIQLNKVLSVTQLPDTPLSGARPLLSGIEFYLKVHTCPYNLTMLFYHRDILRAVTANWLLEPENEEYEG